MEQKSKKRMKEVKKVIWEKRKKKLKFYLFICMFFLLLWGIFTLKKVSQKFLFNLEVFKIKEIEIHPPKITPLITELIQIEKGTSLLFLDISELRNKILQIREVEDCEIRKIFPSKLSITIKLRKVWIGIKEGEKIYFVDKSGTVLQTNGKSENYLIVSGVKINKGVVVKKDFWKLEVLKKIEKWYNFYNLPGYFKIQSIEIVNKNRIILHGEKNFILLTSENIKEKIENLKIILQNFIKEEKKWRYIDLRFKEPYIK